MSTAVNDMRVDDVVGCMDADSHEMIPMHMWADAFGERAAALFTPLAGGLISRAGKNSTKRDDIVDDSMPISYDTVWNHKGPESPSAIDLGRRIDVLDEMRVDRQLVFPTFALIGLNIFHNPAAPEYFGFDPAELDQREAGRAAIDAHNYWAAKTVGELGSSASERIRPVGIVLTESVSAMTAQAEQLIDAGIRALWIPSGVPPAGTSPGDRSLDPFWQIAEAANVPIVFHVGTEFAFASPQWYANVAEFQYGPKSSIEFPIEPYRASTIHLANEAFLGAMILSGVFERFPRLRVGVIECGAHWVGPLAEKLDLWAGQFVSRLQHTLSMAPSQYLSRNVRVTPFFFEPVDEYIERHPDLADVYCFGSDFPHVEGGLDCKRGFADRLARLGDEVTQQFFVGNGSLLLPS